MFSDSPSRGEWFGFVPILGLLLLGCGSRAQNTLPEAEAVKPPAVSRELNYQPRVRMETSGFSLVTTSLVEWSPDATLEEIAEPWTHPGRRGIASVDSFLARDDLPLNERLRPMLVKSMYLNFEGDADRACETLAELRTLVENDPELAESSLYSMMYYQGVTALRRGENDNCVMCRGESSCILPISKAAVHQFPAGSRQAITHFEEYLQRFPDDLEVQWLLNVAYMTLGEYPHAVPEAYRLPMDRYTQSEFDIGRFRDVGHLVGVNHFNQSGGSIMDDFDRDGLLDIAFTAIDPTQKMTLMLNNGTGRFIDVTEAAGVGNQLGGLYCMQTDYDLDGFLDIFIPRGAWQLTAMRPSLLHNEGDGTFRDVTLAAGLLDPVNSNSASWADYDNDGDLDLYVCCEQQPNRLFRNEGNGTFKNVAAEIGAVGSGKAYCKGATWFDYDNDGAPDLFLNYFKGEGRLLHNQGGKFVDVTDELRIDGPQRGFSCWAWDYNNDGWLDIFATSYDLTLGDVVKGLIGQPHERFSNKLFRNNAGQGFIDETKAAGLDLVFATMGSNFADFDNDGWLDFYLSRGEPDLATLVPNRMFRNVDGTRFAEITGTSGTGHLQKGHAVACGDWDRNGNVDLFVQMGGATNGDKYHNVLFENPGQDHHWFAVRLVGRASNRTAHGARLTVTVASDPPRTIHRHISTGSSFGANTLEQTFGLQHDERIAKLQIDWPASGETQVWTDLAADRVVVIVEGSPEIRTLSHTPIPLPTE